MITVCLTVARDITSLFITGEGIGDIDLSSVRFVSSKLSRILGEVQMVVILRLSLVGIRLPLFVF